MESQHYVTDIRDRDKMNRRTLLDNILKNPEAVPQPKVIRVPSDNAAWRLPENRLPRSAYEKASQPYVTKAAQEIMNNTKYQGFPMSEVEIIINYRDNILNLVDPRKEYKKKIKHAKKIQGEIERFGMEPWDDYPKLIAAFYKAVGIIPRTKKRVHNQIKDYLQSEYERILEGQYTNREKKQVEDALSNVACRIRYAMSDEIRDLEDKLKTAELHGETTGEIIRNLADTRIDYRKAFNDETRYSMQVIRHDRAEREYARLALDLQENLEGLNDRVLNATLLRDELHIYVEHNGNALELWKNVLKNKHLHINYGGMKNGSTTLCN